MKKVTVSIPVPTLNNKVTRTVAVVPLTVFAKGKSLAGERPHPVTGTKSKLRARKEAKLQAREADLLPRIAAHAPVQAYWDQAQNTFSFDPDDQSEAAIAQGIATCSALDNLCLFVFQSQISGDQENVALAEETTQLISDIAEFKMNKRQNKEADQIGKVMKKSVESGLTMTETAHLMNANA